MIDIDIVMMDQEFDSAPVKETCEEYDVHYLNPTRIFTNSDRADTQETAHQQTTIDDWLDEHEASPDDVGDRLGENTCSGAIDASAEFTRQMLLALTEAVKHPDMTEEIAEIFSTHFVDVEYRVETGVTID